MRHENKSCQACLKGYQEPQHTILNQPNHSKPYQTLSKPHFSDQTLKQKLVVMFLGLSRTIAYQTKLYQTIPNDHLRGMGRILASLGTVSAYGRNIWEVTIEAQLFLVKKPKIKTHLQQFRQVLPRLGLRLVQSQPHLPGIAQVLDLTQLENTGQQAPVTPVNQVSSTEAKLPGKKLDPAVKFVEQKLTQRFFFLKVRAINYPSSLQSKN